MNIVLVGRAGSGKSTVATGLSQEFGIDVIDSKILARFIESQQEGWQDVERAVRGGDQVPSELLQRAFDFWVLQVGFGKNGVVADNAYSLAGVQMFDQKFSTNLAFYFDVPRDVAHERLRLRGRGDFSAEFLRNRDDTFDKNSRQMLLSLMRRGRLKELIRILGLLSQRVALGDEACLSGFCVGEVACIELGLAVLRYELTHVGQFVLNSTYCAAA